MKLLKGIKTIAVLLVVALTCLGAADQAVAQEGLPDILDRARNAGIEQSMLEELQAKAKKRGLGTQEVANLIKPAVSLAEKDLPADHLIQKSLEGLSKGVPSSRIHSFISRLQSSTQQAATIVDPWMKSSKVQQMISQQGGAASGSAIRNNMIKASSRAITQDIPAESIRQVLSDINNQSVLSKTSPSNIVSAINILPDLGVKDQPKLASSFVVRALKGGFNADELQKLPAALSMAQQRSQLPAASIMKGVSKQLTGGVPASEVLQNLFKGNIGGGPPGNVPKGLQGNPGKGTGNGGHSG